MINESINPENEKIPEEEVKKENIERLLNERLEILNKLKTIEEEVKEKGYGAKIDHEEIQRLEKRVKEIETNPEVLAKLYDQAKEEEPLWQESTKGYALLDLDEMEKAGIKWGIGAFLKLESPLHSKNIEVGKVTLSEEIPKGEKHIHEALEESYLVLKGKLILKVGNQTIEVGSKQLLLVKPNFPHEIIDFEPGTELVLIKTPSKLGDKKVVE